MMGKKRNIVKEKSFDFALQVINVYKLLVKEKKEYVMSKQLLRSGTAVGALIREAEHAESKADFLHKMSIALKEANETEYWIDLLIQSKYFDRNYQTMLKQNSSELIKLLASIVKTTKKNLNRNYE